MLTDHGFIVMSL